VTLAAVVPGEPLEIQGVRVWVRRQGHGEPVVLLHGMGASAYSWRHVVGPLAADFSVTAFDWPGHGRSEQPMSFDYSSGGYSRFLLALLDKLGAAKAALVGNSMGGVVALRTAIEAPERVSRMVLIGTPTYPHNRPALLWPLTWPVAGKLLENLLGPWAVPIVARSAFYDPSMVTQELVNEYSQALSKPGGRRAIADFLRTAIPSDVDAFIERYKKLTMPVLVLRGSHDGVLDEASAKRFASEVPKGRFVSFDLSGHAPQEESPERVVPVLREFLRDGR